MPGGRLRLWRKIVTCSETLPSDGGEQPDAGCVLWRAALAREGFPSTASREREAGGNSLLEKRHRLLLGDNIEFPAGRRARSGERARGEFPAGEWEGFYGRRG